VSDGLRKTLIDEKRLILGIRQASHARLVATRDTADAEYKWVLDSIERLLALSTPAVRQIRRRLKVHRKGKFERQAFWGDLIAWIVRTLINGHNLGEGAACEEAAAILAKLFPSAARSAKAIRSLYYHRLGTEPQNAPR